MYQHLKDKKVSYVQHFIFAFGISLKLTLSSTAFFVHALLPFIRIPYDLNLDSMALYLFEKNNELED